MRSACRLWFLVVVSTYAAVASANEVSTGIFVRTDTDDTTVVSPSAGAQARVFDDSTTVDVGYAADIWTSASIDIRTAATMRVTEQRDEITAALAREATDVTLRAAYRFSHEVDYESHGGSVGVEQRLAQGNATVDTTISAAQDTVGRAGDDGFARGLSTVGARVLYTQVVDAETIVQGGYELFRRDGFQSSPYRFVAVGGDGLCNATARFCVPESHPAVRLRHAFVARGRRALGHDASAGLGYRLYVDDWGIASHTALGQVAWLPDDRSTLLARYRFYYQTAAQFYRVRYDGSAPSLRFATRDRELGPMSTHRLVLSFEREVDLAEAGPYARITVAVGGNVLGYRDFIGLGTTLALDVTLGATVEL